MMTAQKIGSNKNKKSSLTGCFFQQVKSGSGGKNFEVRTEMKLAQDEAGPAATGGESKRRMPTGQSLVSKTTGTRIMNGMTTVHETSTIGTTIDGQYAHFVQSTSRVFQEPSSTPAAPAIPGSVEVVTDLPSLNVVQKSSGKTTTNTPPSAE